MCTTRYSTWLSLKCDPSFLASIDRTPYQQGAQQTKCKCHPAEMVINEIQHEQAHLHTDAAHKHAIRCTIPRRTLIWMTLMLVVKNTCIWSYHHHQKSEVWPICHCLGLGHETMVRAVYLSIFFFLMVYEYYDWCNRRMYTIHHTIAEAIRLRSSIVYMALIYGCICSVAVWVAAVMCNYHLRVSDSCLRSRLKISTYNKSLTPYL